MNKGYLRFMVFAVLVPVLAIAAGCSQRLSEEEVIRRMIEEVAESARNKDIEGITSRISKDFTDDHDNDYKSLRALIFYEFMRSDKISVVIRSMDMKVKDREALVDVRLLLIKGEDIKTIGDVLPKGAKALRVNVVLRMEEGRWKALSAKWKDPGALGLL